MPIYTNGLEDSAPDDFPPIPIIDIPICNSQPDEVLNSLDYTPSQPSILKSLKQDYKDLYAQSANLSPLRSFYLKKKICFLQTKKYAFIVLQTTDGQNISKLQKYKFTDRV